jgi:hypothetical protein
MRVLEGEDLFIIFFWFAEAPNSVETTDTCVVTFFMCFQTKNKRCFQQHYFTREQPVKIPGHMLHQNHFVLPTPIVTLRQELYAIRSLTQLLTWAS